MKTNKLTEFACSILTVAALVSCAANNTDKTAETDSGIVGRWTEPVPGLPGMTQGISLEEGGKATSVNMSTLRYTSWRQEDNKLILAGESLGNGATIPFTDTLLIEKSTPDSLILRKKALLIRYSRADKEAAGQTLQGQNRTATVTGTVVIGHETRSFTPENDTFSYWISDKTGRLFKEYDKLTGGKKNGMPVYAELEIEDCGKSDEGFAKNYKSVYNVISVNKMALKK